MDKYFIYIKSMINIEELNLSPGWKEVFNSFQRNCINYNNYHECIGFSYKISPLIDNCMSPKLLTKEKMSAIYTWYRNKNSRDHSIEEYFPEYRLCTDSKHLDFNSNYGLYAYNKDGLDKCIKRLSENDMTRQAMFCINNNVAMSDCSIDKLCTNTVQFFIRNNKLQMVIQMRASNLLTLLPYDSFMFCYWYFYVFNKLCKESKFKNLEVDYIYINAATIHYYDSNLSYICNEDNDIKTYLFDNFRDEDFLEKFEKEIKKEK